MSDSGPEIYRYFVVQTKGSSATFKIEVIAPKDFYKQPTRWERFKHFIMNWIFR